MWVRISNSGFKTGSNKIKRVFCGLSRVCRTKRSESSYRVIKAGVLHKDDMKCFTKSPGNGETPQSPARGLGSCMGKGRAGLRPWATLRTEWVGCRGQKGQKRSSTSLHTLNQRDGACNLGWGAADSPQEIWIIIRHLI